MAAFTLPEVTPCRLYFF